MNLTVFTGPDPGANFEELLKRTPLASGSVCAIVPDSYSVKAMERLLAGFTGGAFLGHRVFTFQGLAQSMLALRGAVPELISDHAKRALLNEIVRSRIGEQSPYFTVSRYPGFMSLVISFLQDIRSLKRGVNGDDIHPDLRSIAAAYEILLRKFGLTDNEGLVALALEGECAERFSALFRGPLIVDGFYDFTEKQFELLLGLFGWFNRSAVTLVNDPARPGLFALSQRLLDRYMLIGARIIAVEKEPEGNADLVLAGFMGGQYSTSAPGGDVRIHTFRSETAEADWVCGTIHSLITEGTCDPGDVMIVSRNQPGYGSPVHSALKRHGIPVEGKIERPLTGHPLIRLVLDALEASVTADNALIVRVRQSSYTGGLAFSRYFPVDSMDDRGWSCMIAETDTPEGFVTSFRRMLEQLRIKENICRSDMNELKLSELIVYEKLMELLKEFEALYTPFRKMMKAAEFNSLLRQFLENVTIPDTSSYGHGVLVAGVNLARHIRRRVVFMTGLDNASFPLRHDTYTLHGAMRARALSEHHDLEEGLLFYMSCAGARRLYLTFPGIDDEGSDASMSPYLENIRDGIAQWQKPVFHHAVPGAAWQEGAVSTRGREENIVRVLRGYDAVSSSVLDELGKRDISLEHRLREAVMDCAGRTGGRDLSLREIASLGHIADEWGNDRVFSVTELERYISCPVDFFLSRILGLEIEWYEENEIAPADMGILIHEILAEFYTMRREKKGQASFSHRELDDCRLLMKGIIERKTAGVLAGGEKLHPVIFLSERKHIQAWMDAFLEKEAVYFEETRFEPAYIEVAFGVSGRRAVYDYPPLILEFGNERVLVGGRIDRIDTESTGHGCSVRVVDYKTGFVNTSQNKLEEGTAIQIPLYLKAVVEHIVPDGIPFDGVYYTLREMEMEGYKLNREPIRGELWESYFRIAGKSACTAASEIRKGHFAPDTVACKDYCEFRALCMGARLLMGRVPDADT